MLPEQQGKRLALVVGVDYAPQSRKAPLHYARQDAEDIAKILREPYCRFDEVTLLQNEQALTGTVQDIFTEAIGSTNKADLLLFYFAGHGIQMTRPQGNPDVFLVTYDFNYDNATINPARYISLSWLRDMLYGNMTRTGSIVLILDNCYAGFMIEQFVDKTFAESTDFTQLSEIFNDLLLLRGEKLQPSGQGLRRVFAATGSNDQAREEEGHGAMTKHILSALQGNEPFAKSETGEVTVARLYSFLQERMFQNELLPLDYQGTDRNRPPCVLAYHDPVIIQAARSHPALLYFVPRELSQHFQFRYGEFDELLRRLKAASGKPLGLIGMPGIGKSELAAQFAFAHKSAFPDGIYLIEARDLRPEENRLASWRTRFAMLARTLDYRPSPGQDDEESLASYFAAYLASSTQALLILDGVEDPREIPKLITVLAGRPMQCALLYTSINPYESDDIATYQVPTLTTAQAYRLLLPDQRSTTLAALESQQIDSEAAATRTICSYLANHPLALTVLRAFLNDEPTLTLEELAGELRKRGFFALTQDAQISNENVLEMFAMVWERIRHPAAEWLFKLLAYYPDIAAIPLWLSGLTADLSSEGGVLSPLHRAWKRLHNLSLVMYLEKPQVLQLHPMLREFGKRLTKSDEEQAELQEAGQRLAIALMDLSLLEERARLDYWACLDQLRAAITYIRELAGNITGQLLPIERALDRESHLLASGNFWPEPFPALFHQQITNRLASQKALTGLQSRSPQDLWLRLLNRIGSGAERQRILSGHEREVTSVAFSPDGQEILTTSEDGEAHILEAASGRIRACLRKHTDGVTCGAFSQDGEYLLTASRDHTITLWRWDRDFSLAQEIYSFSHPDEVFSAAFSPDGRFMLSGSHDNLARLWEIKTHQIVQVFSGHQLPISSVAFSPDGKWVLTGSWDKTARLWDASTGQAIKTFGYVIRREWPTYAPYFENALTGERIQQPGVREIDERAGRIVTSVAFSPDGQFILTASNDGRVWLWEISSGEMVRAFGPHNSEVANVAFSPDGHLLLTGSGDSAVRVWDVATGKLLTTFPASGRIKSVTFAPDGRKVLAGSNDNRALLWQIPGEVVARKQIRDHLPLNFVTQVALGRTQTSFYALSGFENGDVWFWSRNRQGQFTHTLHKNTRNGSVTSLAFAENCQTFLVGSFRGHATHWEFQQAPVQEMRSGHQVIHAAPVTTSLFLPDRRTLLSASQDGKVLLWTPGEQNQARITITHTAPRNIPISCAAISNQGTLLLVGLADGQLILWAAKRHEEKLRWQGHNSDITGLAFFPDDRYMISSGGDMRTCLWNTQSGDLVAVLSEQKDEVRLFAFSPNGKLLLACNNRGNLVRLWTLDTSGAIPNCQLRGIYSTHHHICAALWLSDKEFLLADTGNTAGRPSFYRLSVENLA